MLVRWPEHFIRRAFPLLALTALAGGCGLALGLGDFTESAPPTTSSTSSASTGSTSTSTSSGMGGMGAGGSSATTGSGGGGGKAFCKPNSTMTCYTGPAATEGVGACKGGTQTCLADGSAYGACTGEITPAATDDCAKVVDSNCDGTTTCSCTPNQTAACYDGVAATEGVGTCKGGTHTCDAMGSSFGACMGEILPAAIDGCTTPDDENCDGVVNDSCTCAPNSTAACYAGPAATQGVGQCKAGTKLCNVTGTAYGVCTGEIDPSADVCSNMLDEDCNGSYCTQTLWAKDFGDSANQGPTSVATDSDGNVIVGGFNVGTLNFGMNPLLNVGGTDGFVAKLDPKGGYLWAKALGDGSNQSVTSVAVDASKNVYIAGQFVGAIDFSPVGTLTAVGCDLFIAKLDPNGNYLWAKQFGNTSVCEPGPIYITIHGTSIYAAGTYQGGLTMGNTITAPTNPATDGFVGKLDAATGTGNWVRAIGESPGTNSTQEVNGLAVDSAGTVYTTGFMQGTVSFGNATLNGPTNFLAKWDSLGNNLTAVSWGLTGLSGGSSIAVDVNGNIFIASPFSQAITIGNTPLTLAPGSAVNLLAFKYNPNLTVNWAKSYGTNGNQQQPFMTLTPDGGLAITGWMTLTNDFGGGAVGSGGTKGDVFVLKLDGTGKHVWSRAYGDALTAQQGVAVAADTAGNLFVVGDNEGNVDFGLGPLNCGGNTDVFVAKIAGQ